MQRTAVPLFLLIFFFSGIVVPASGQQTETQAQQNLLPEIDPQDIEIRSQFQARFPGLRRQPILGFNPKPRIFQLDPNRTPFIESEEAVAASVPVGQLDRPEAPVYKPLSYADPSMGFARIGIGTYITPEVDIYAIKGFRDKNWVSGNISHRSSNGHLENQDSSFRDFRTSVRSRLSLTQKALLHLNTGIFTEFNYLPADELNNIPENPAVSKSSRSGIRFGGEFSYDQTSLTGFESEFNVYSHQFELSDTGGESETIPGTATEWGASVSSGYYWAGSRIEEVFSAYLGFDTGNIETIGSVNNNWSILEGGAGYERLLNYQTDIDAYFGLALVSDAYDGSAFYIVPKIDARHTLLDGLDVRLRLSGAPNHQSIREIQQRNKFLGLTTPVAHQYNSELRAEVIFEPLSGTMLTGGSQFQHIRNYTYFTRNERSTELLPGEIITTRYSYRSNFENANFLKVYASFSQQLAAEKFWISSDVYWQRPRLSGNDKIPYVESLGVSATASFRPIRDLVIEGWANYKGSRHNPAGDDLDSYFLLGSRFELALAANAGIYAKIMNINDVEYQVWQGYPERGFQAYVGITYLF